MAKMNTLGGGGEVFIGEDKSFALELLDTDAIPVNMSGWTVNMVISLTLTSAALYTRAATVAGTYSATRAVNTQRATAVFTDDETATLTKGTYQFSFKRDSAGVETLLAWGVLHVQRANTV